MFLGRSPLANRSVAACYRGARLFDQAEEYRRRAQEAEENAKQASIPEARTTFGESARVARTR
jgi:hypothetical protein